MHPDPCFTLRVRLYRRDVDNRIITIRAYDNLTPGWDEAGRVRLTCSVHHGGKEIFPYGQLTCALHAASDSIEAKELIMSLVGMHPGARGGEGADYYADYTPEQMQWCETHGEALDMERSARYCDPETGAVRRVS